MSAVLRVSAMSTQTHSNSAGGAVGLSLESLLSARASVCPENIPGLDTGTLREALQKICQQILLRQADDGLWHSTENPNYQHRFYADSYAVRALIAAAEILDQPDYREAALKWVFNYIGQQRPDGGWWVGYSWGDNDNATDRSVVYVADAGETTVALAAAFHSLRQLQDKDLRADKIHQSLSLFRDFADLFRLRSGAMGLGYTERDFYRIGRGCGPRPFMQGHFRPFPFATVVTGINFNALMYSIDGKEKDWDKAMASLDWCLENSYVDVSIGSRHGEERLFGGKLDLMYLFRAMDLAYTCSTAPYDRVDGFNAAAEPTFVSVERQKLYSIWRYIMHLLADSQSDIGEWPVIQDDKALVGYSGPLRHRLYYLYALTAYLQHNGSIIPGDERIRRARDRQLWLCLEPQILSRHYGAGFAENQMPAGLWGMTLCELLRPGSTMPWRGKTSPFL